MLRLFSFIFIVVCSNCSAQTFTLKSKDLGGQADSKQVFNGFGCSGENLSPQLSWENVPANTQSFAVTIFDKDAPTGSGWWHWIIFDIDKNLHELVTGAGTKGRGLAPTGSIQSKTDFGSLGYGGPCPPPGQGFHQYIITVYALDVPKLGLDENANPALAGFNLNQHTISKASLVFYYKR